MSDYDSSDGYESDEFKRYKREQQRDMNIFEENLQRESESQRKYLFIENLETLGAEIENLDLLKSSLSGKNKVTLGNIILRLDALHNKFLNDYVTPLSDGFYGLR